MVSRRRRIGDYLARVRRTPARVESALNAVQALQRRVEELERAATQARTDQGIVRRATMLAAYRSMHTDPDRIRIIFLIHNTSGWDSIASVVHAAISDPRFETYVISIPKHFPGDEGFGGEEEVHEFLDRQDIPHWRFGFDDSFRGLDVLFRLNPDVLFRQSQWDGDVPPGYAAEHLTFTRLCLIGYEMLNTSVNVPWGDTVKDTAVDSVYHRLCWRVFAPNDVAMRQARKRSLMQGHQFVDLGHPKAEAIRSAIPAWPVHRPGRRWRVAWHGHHSILSGWNDFGVFPRVWRDMVAWAESAPDVDFVFSPHPALRTLLASPDLKDPSPAEVSEFWERWNALPNTAAHLTGDYLGLLQAADCVVTDGISMLHEYQITGTPVLFIERPGHAKFNRAGRIVVKGVHRLPDVASAREWSERLEGGEPDPLAPEQAAIVARLFGAQGVGKAIVDHIASAIEDESRRA